MNDSMFKDRSILDGLVKKIKSYNGRTIKLMEVCGTHTMAISRFGIRSILPRGIRLLSGPGCPVCVTPGYFIRAALSLAKRSDVIITTFGDLMRIPSGGSSLIEEKAKGADVRIVYSPLDSVKIAEDNPSKKVIFLSVGFETTIPVIALSVLEAYEKGIKNYMLLNAVKTVPQVLKLLAADSELEVDGFIYPGNVSVIIGEGLYKELSEVYKKPGIISGFEPAEILGTVEKLVSMISKGDAGFYNYYSRAVKPEGNQLALSKINMVFAPCDSKWRGIGTISRSGLAVREEFREFDAWEMIGAGGEEDFEPQGCICGEILKGRKLPGDCGLFGHTCKPDSPVGACMVSSEGTCAAYYKYGS